MKNYNSGKMNESFFSDSIHEPSARFFYEKFGIDSSDMQKILNEALSRGGDFAELYFEYDIANSVRMEEDIIKNSTEHIGHGVGIRVIKGDQTGYGYTSDLNFNKIKQAALIAASIASANNQTKVTGLDENIKTHLVYDLNEPLSNTKLTIKIDLIKEAYEAAQKTDPRITKIETVFTDSIQYITIANSEGLIVSDVRPQVRLFVRAVAEEKGNRNSGFSSDGGCVGLNFFTNKKTPAEIGREAAKEAVTLLSAVDPPAGEQVVVLGATQSGVMIHEAVGHPLEADGNWKKTSIMCERLGEMVASTNVTIYDDPTIPHFRGSQFIDDEGTETQKSILIEDGKLVGFLHDRLSAKMMNMKTNGHGRRESYQHNPVPRMSNTVLARGDTDPEEIIRSVNKGFYAHSYQGGQVQDSGKFTFSVNLGYMIENGKLTHPVKNATLIGTNIQILNDVDMIGNDMGFFLGTCGKEGQSAPVTSGTPTIKIRKMTVGGRK
jgi:TldD protein